MFFLVGFGAAVGLVGGLSELNEFLMEGMDI